MRLGTRSRSGLAWVWAGALAVTCVFAMAAPEARAFVLEDAVQLAIRTHPTVQAARELRCAAPPTRASNRRAPGSFRRSMPVPPRAGPAPTTRRRAREANRTARESQSRNLYRGESSLTASQMLWDGWLTRNLTDSA